MSTATITREIAQKVRDIVDAGLVSGLGVPVPGQMCVEAAVCYALGLPHGDDPGCVSAPLRQIKIGLNDACWSSPSARASGLRRLAVAQLGSAGVLDEREFVRRVVDMTIRTAVPAGLRSAATTHPQYAQALVTAAERCEHEGTRDACLRAEDVARDAEAYSAAYAAASAATAAKWQLVSDRRALMSAAAYLTGSAAADAIDARSAAATEVAATATAGTLASVEADADAVLADYAERIVQILIDLQAPGCAWLDVVPVEAV